MGTARPSIADQALSPAPGTGASDVVTAGRPRPQAAGAGQPGPGLFDRDSIASMLAGRTA